MQLRFIGAALAADDDHPRQQAAPRALLAIDRIEVRKHLGQGVVLQGIAAVAGADQTLAAAGPNEADALAAA